MGKHGLTVTEEGGNTFHAPLDDLHAFSIELGGKFFFRVKGDVYELRTESESLYKWDYFLRQWKLEVVGTEY